MTYADIHINRHDEIAHFQRMLAGQAPPVWLIEGDSGAGKSYLLDYLMDDICTAGGVPYVLFDFKDSTPTFVHLTVQTVYRLGHGQRIELERCLHEFSLNGVTVEVSAVRAIAGGHVNIGVDAASLGKLSPSQLAVWHNRFAEALMADIPTQPAVLFVDTFEKANVETREWLVQTLMPLLPDARGGLLTVIAGQQAPVLTRSWRAHHVTHTRLTGLSTGDWVEYAERFAARQGKTPPEVGFVRSYHGFFQGKPRAMVDAIGYLCGSGAA